MAITVAQVAPLQVADVDAYWPEVVALYEPAWRCSSNPDVTLPDAEWVKRVVVGAAHAVAVGVERKAVHGVVVWRLSPAPPRIVWLYANPARWGEAAVALAGHVSVAAGAAPWGVVEQQAPRDAFLATGRFTLWGERPQYPAGTVIRFVP